MSELIAKFYRIDKTLQGNPSVEKLIELMDVKYTLHSRRLKIDDQKQQQIHVAPITGISLGFWPMKGLVGHIPYTSKLVKLIGENILHPMSFYGHEYGMPRISFVLTMDEGRMKKHGLERLMPGHEINLYLERRKR